MCIEVLGESVVCFPFWKWIVYYATSNNWFSHRVRGVISSKGQADATLEASPSNKELIAAP